MNQHIQSKEYELDELIRECETLFNKTTELMIHSEQQAGKKYYKNGFPFSPKLKEAGDEIFQLRKQLRICSTELGRENKEYRQLKGRVQKAYQSLQEVQSDATKHRRDHLQQLATKRSQQWNVTAAQAANIIEEAEASKETHSKLRNFIKP